MIKTVIKRDGTTAEFDADKLNRWAEWASENCGVSWSSVILEACKGLNDGSKTSDIHNTLIAACVNRRDTGHSRMAARLLIGQIYKEAFGAFGVEHLVTFYKRMVAAGLWADMGYSEEELYKLNDAIDHSKDFGYEYCTIRQFYDKYAIKSFDVCMESPQMAFMGMAMANRMNDENRVESAIGLYEEISSLLINLPTPTLSGQRTNTGGSPSCCLISGGDSVDSIESTVHVAYKMTALSSGIGAEMEIRSPLDPVKNGTISHMGKLGYYRYLDRAVKSNRQQSRGGSANVNFSVFDPEIEVLLRLKSQRVHADSRIDSMDYTLQVNNLFSEKVAKNEQWMLVSSYFAKRLYDLQFSGDLQALKDEYERVASDDSIKKTFVNAREIAGLFVVERSDTGRIYRMNTTNANKHTPFKDPIRMVNLCVEIALPTKPFETTAELYSSQTIENAISSGEQPPEVALCFIASVVAGGVDIVDGVIDLDKYLKTAYEVAKTVDNTIDQATYPFAAIEHTAKARRSIGIGITDLAHLMARHGMKYDDEAGRNFIHRLAEVHSYALHRASVRLAIERGKCEWFDRTKYSDEKPWLPIDTYTDVIDQHHSQPLLMDWEGLRADIKKHGMRFSVLEAFMPVESSSVFTASTNGLYPIRDKKIFKKSGSGSVYFEAPELEALSENYQSAYDIDALDMLKVYGIIQKFCGQTISADLYQDLSNGKKVSMADEYRKAIFSDRIGVKTWYYLNTLDNKNSTEVVEQDTTGMCEACTL